MKNARIKEDLKHRNAKDASEFIPSVAWVAFLATNPACHLAAHRANF